MWAASKERPGKSGERSNLSGPGPTTELDRDGGKARGGVGVLAGLGGGSWWLKSWPWNAAIFQAQAFRLLGSGFRLSGLRLSGVRLSGVRLLGFRPYAGRHRTNQGNRRHRLHTNTGALPRATRNHCAHPDCTRRPQPKQLTATTRLRGNANDCTELVGTGEGLCFCMASALRWAGRAMGSPFRAEGDFGPDHCPPGPVRFFGHAKAKHRRSFH